ncbi:NAD-dependent epimerase/dehydratase family protein [Kerstersia sp.]|uniref:NAD-dependent epimerase/dehydratase family protein n=1 Tax=Kerstersia sp. TaxID=1930783 RepID=UPI003F8F9F25
MALQIVVLGASGYLGRHLIDRLRACPDWNIVGVSRHKPADWPADVAFQVADATEPQALEALLAQADAVINGISGSPAIIAASARALASALLRASRPAGSAPIRLIHMSSMSVYGNVQGDINEAQPLIPPGETDYASAKSLAETLLSAHANSILLRPGCIYGYQSPQWTLRPLQLLRAGRLGDLGENGDGYSNLVHVDDVLDAICAALRAPANVGSQAYNLAMPDAPRWNIYFERLALAAGAVPVRRISRRQYALETRVLAPLLFIASKLGRKVGLRHLPPPISPSLAALWRQDIRLDSGKATLAWQMQWRSLDAGIADCVPQAPATA